MNCYDKEKDIPIRDIVQLSAYVEGEKEVRSFLGRLCQGCRLWLAKLNDELAGYHWTIIGGWEGFWHFPMTQSDAVIFDGVVFPEFRGQGIRPRMIQYTLQKLKRERIQRFFVGTKVWNKSNYRCIMKTSFHKVGTVRSLQILGRKIAIWPNKK